MLLVFPASSGSSSSPRFPSTLSLLLCGPLTHGCFSLVVLADNGPCPLPHTSNMLVACPEFFLLPPLQGGPCHSPQAESEALRGKGRSGHWSRGRARPEWPFSTRPRGSPGKGPGTLTEPLCAGKHSLTDNSSLSHDVEVHYPHFTDDDT